MGDIAGDVAAYILGSSIGEAVEYMVSTEVDIVVGQTIGVGNNSVVH